MEKKNTYLNAQKSTRDKINDLTAQIIDRKLKHIIQDGGTNSKQFWNIYRQVKKPNAEDIDILVTEDGDFVYTPEEIMEYNAMYYENLYTPRSGPQFNKDWTYLIEAKVKEYEANLDYEDLLMNQPLTRKEISLVIKDQPNNKSRGLITSPMNLL